MVENYDRERCLLFREPINPGVLQIINYTKQNKNFIFLQNHKEENVGIFNKKSGSYLLKLKSKYGF